MPDMRVKITEKDIRTFASGDCHVLARKVHEITGWPICAFWLEEKPNEHAFVLAPTGHAVDIQGVHPLVELGKDWLEDDEAEICEVTFDELLEHGWPEGCDVAAPRRAEQLAPHVIANAERALHLEASSVT